MFASADQFGQAAFGELDSHDVGQLTSDDFVKACEHFQIRTCVAKTTFLLPLAQGLLRLGYAEATELVNVRHI